MADFDLIQWKINMKDETYEALTTNPVVQAKFVHEYIHYIQSLMGTLGRVILAELLRLSIAVAGIVRGYTRDSIIVPKIDVLNALRNANSEDITDKGLFDQYKDIWDQLQFTMNIVNLEDRAIVDISAPFEKRNIIVGKDLLENYVFVKGKMNNKQFSVPLTERVVFDNMARQVQRNYLIHNNNGDTSIIDKYREKPNEFYYTCLHDIITRYMPKSALPKNPTAWTFIICQYAILCGNPNHAFEFLFNLLKQFGGNKLEEDFLQRLWSDSWINRQFNAPKLKGVINDIRAYFKFAVSQNQTDIKTLLDSIEKAYSSVRENVWLFYVPKLKWEGFLDWIRSYGCPPVEFKDGKRTDIDGIDISSPWQPYLEQTHRLLSR